MHNLWLNHGSSYGRTVFQYDKSPDLHACSCNTKNCKNVASIVTQEQQCFKALPQHYQSPPPPENYIILEHTLPVINTIHFYSPLDLMVCVIHILCSSTSPHSQILTFPHPPPPPHPSTPPPPLPKINRTNMLLQLWYKIHQGYRQFRDVQYSEEF